MTTVKPERPIVLITDETTKAELAETLSLLNDDAKTYSRRGYAGTRCDDYGVAHKRINAILDDWQDAPA